MLNSERITFCVDTNVLVEFKALDQIPWWEITPNAKEVRLVVLTKVGEEMDEHKKKTGRLRKRALEFTQIARRIEDSAEERAVLHERDPTVTIEFSPIYRRIELDGDLYDLDDKDGRIVAEAARFMQDHPDAVFLADDSKPLRWARKTGLPCERPPESWRRQEGPDERDREIAELKRELGAQPALSISFPDAINDRGEHVLEPPPVASCKVCSDQLVSAVLAANRRVPREASIACYGLARPDRFGISGFDSLTDSDLNQYEHDHAEFEKGVRWWADNQPKLFAAVSQVLPIEVEIANDGDRGAERVLVELALAGPFYFELHDSIEPFTGGWLIPPSPPQPRGPLHIAPPFVPTPELSKPHEFYALDDPEADGSTTRLEWRCEEFRHGQKALLPVIVRATDEAARGALKVRASSAVMAKTAEATAPLICFKESTENSRLCSYLERRIELLPHRYQEPVRRALSASSRSCPAGSPPAGG